MASAQDDSYGTLPARPFTQDFQARGIAGLERLQEDSVQAACNHWAPRSVVQALEQAQLAAIKFPADGKFLGDWKAGEKIAQKGGGMTWSDKAGTENGGNCYNCHQLSKAETSFGTIGPSLNQYGALRGNSPEIQKYTYSKIFNAKAYNLCSTMPRFGHAGALTEKQIKDLVALLLDPESPVNKK
ncbi:MAG: sulfur oxidation c-type cytochrome SoxX [Burkholderiales bacterium]|nr:sulfur oxidation c-type cytochrome SoxX [Burkholderiales bacterium]